MVSSERTSPVLRWCPAPMGELLELQVQPVPLGDSVDDPHRLADDLRPDAVPWYDRYFLQPNLSLVYAISPPFSTSIMTNGG